MSGMIVLLCALLMLASAVCSAGTTTNLEPKMVAVFKNGLGFFVRTGEAQLVDGWGVTDFVPQATMGAFWMSTPAPGSYVDEIVAYQEEVDTKRDARTIDELLRANIDKRVRIARGTLPEIEGAIQSVASGGGEAIVRVLTHFGQVLAFPKSQISSIQFTGEFEPGTSDKTKENRIKFKLSNAPAASPVTMAYLSKGITWVPSYLIDIEDPEKARITFKSTLMNDVEDLENLEVLFVVGYPNFAFSDTMSPMALQHSVSDLIRGAVSVEGRRREYLSNWMTQSAVSGRYGGYAGSMPADVPPSVSDYSSVSTPGQAEEDLFLYTKEGVSIKKGERAAYTIFTALVDCEHIYEWTAADTSGVDPWGYRLQGDREVKPEDAVWHSLRLTNSTDYPWTTAPALVVSGNKPLAQDELSYTSRKAKGVLKMTVATDIAVEKREDEIERKHDVKISNRTYEQVTVRGELSLTNYKTEPAKLIVKKNVTGEVISTDPKAEVSKTAQGLAGVNPRSLITWEFDLPAGENVKLTYESKTYVRP